MRKLSTFQKITLGVLVQTSLFSLTLLWAYYFWDAPNARLVIGTGWPVFVPVFCLLSLLQNLIVQRSKSTFKWFVCVAFFLLLSGFFFYPSGSFAAIACIWAAIVSVPLLLNRLQHPWQNARD